MIKQISFAVLITLVFIGAVVVFELIHRRTETEVAQVEGEYLKVVNTELKTEFIENLQSRQVDNLSPDLIY